jgi:N-acetylmuramoyl-L-alanine amidase
MGRYNKIIKAIIITIVFVVIQSPLLSLNINIRSFDHAGYTRLVLEGDRSFEFSVDSSGKSLDIKLKSQSNHKEQLIPVRNSKLISGVLHKKTDSGSVYSVKLKSNFEVKNNFVLERPFRVVFDLTESANDGKAAKETEQEIPQEDDTEEPEEQYSPPSQNLAITTVCIDAGHGGNDMGSVGKTGLMEKDVTLQISQKLKNIIEGRLGLRVVMTRSKDSEVSLNSRVAIANNQKAQLFVSIHINSSYRNSARGTATYYVSLKATDQESYELAQKENRSYGKSDEEAMENDALKMILWNMAQTDYIRESSKLAEFIQRECNSLMNTINRGVKQAPFRVLMRAAMPAVLVEVAFISNPTEERKLKEEAFLNRVALAIYNGIAKFIRYHDQIYR